MNTPDQIESPARSRLRFELIMGSVWLAVGLFIVPALIFWVGSNLLGPYGEKAGLSDFYGAFFADLASGASRTWLLALGPLLLTSVVRAIFIGVGSGRAVQDDSDDQPTPRKQNRSEAPAERRRVEPRVG